MGRRGGRWRARRRGRGRKGRYGEEKDIGSLGFVMGAWRVVVYYATPSPRSVHGKLRGVACGGGCRWVDEITWGCGC